MSKTGSCEEPILSRLIEPKFCHSVEACCCTFPSPYLAWHLSDATLSAFSFVLSAFGRIQIHCQIWNFIEQYKSAYPGLGIKSRRTVWVSRCLAALFCGDSTKKEKEKSKREEENGDRKINTLISETASSLGLPLFSHSWIVSFLIDFPPFSSVIWSKLRHDGARRRGDSLKEYFQAEAQLRHLFDVPHYKDGRSSFSEQSLFYWKGQSLLTTLKPNIFLLCIAVSLFSSGFTSLFKSNAKIVIDYTFQSYCPREIRLSLHHYDTWSLLCNPWAPIHDFWWKKKTLLTKENALINNS